MPEALSAEAAVDLPILSALLSLPFYLLCLLLASVHVLVCTSAESSCYFCSLSWGLVFAAVAFSAAMFCILVSMATRRLSLGPKIHGKVSLSASKYTNPKQVQIITDVYSHRGGATCVEYIQQAVKYQYAAWLVNCVSWSVISLEQRKVMI